MAQSSDNLLGNQDLAADRAVLALGQTGFGTGGCDGLVDDLGVGQLSADNVFTAQLLAAEVAVDHGVVGTGHGTGGIDGILDHSIGRGMPQSGNRDCLAGDFHTADRAVADRIVGAILDAGSGLLVFMDSLTGGMAQGIGFVSHIGDAADGADVGGVAALGAGGGCGDAAAGGMLGVHSAVHIEDILSILKIPAVLQRIDQGVAVAEGGVIVTKGSAPVAGIVGIDVGGQAIGLLVGGIIGKGVQRTCGQVELIAQHGTVDGNEGAVCIPGSLCLGREPDAADHADGVGGGRLDGAGLLDPVQLHVQHVGFGVQRCAAEGEVFILEAQTGQVHVEIGIDLDGGADLGEDTDPVSQLKQEAPGGAVGLVCAGQHVGQLLQPLGDRNGGHIDGECVACHHGSSGVHNMVGIVILGGGVGNLTQPCQLAVAAGGLVEVEDHVAGLVHGDGDGVPGVDIASEGGGDGDGLQTGGLIAGEGKAGDGAAADALVIFADLESHILRGQGHGLSLV